MNKAPEEEQELYSSWALLIQTTLLILALLTSYYLQVKQIRAMHETVVSIFAGLRGAVAFALAAGLKGDNANAMRTTILVVVVLSVIVFGGTTSKMIEICKIKMGVEEQNNDSEDEDYDVYGEYQINSQGSIESNETGSSMEQHNFLSVGIPPVIPTASQTHWFISFDDRFLKPLFTRQRGIRHRIDDRWRSVRRECGEEDFIGLANDRRDTSGTNNRENDLSRDSTIGLDIFKSNGNTNDSTVANDSVLSTNVGVEDNGEGGGKHPSFTDLSVLIENRENNEGNSDKPLVNFKDDLI
ncbi:9988_t:CDS:2 [Acaulospora colombiana]|uniref:9988_t:CDS:1 n=1 Tax=Acaulospora colombiana TaxID=27376 RepID=A0ACA9K9U9_9GLOM|nr:9988_t:CDS:2 [Acaulospora colombiana]